MPSTRELGLGGATSVSTCGAGGSQATSTRNAVCTLLHWLSLHVSCVNLVSYRHLYRARRVKPHTADVSVVSFCSSNNILHLAHLHAKPSCAHTRVSELATPGVCDWTLLQQRSPGRLDECLHERQTPSQERGYGTACTGRASGLKARLGDAHDNTSRRL